MTDEQVLEEAQKRVKARRDFYGHLGAWVLVNTILIIVWALGDRGYPWFLWPLCIWGAVVFMNYLSVFVFGKKSDAGAIEREVEKIKREQD